MEQINEDIWASKLAYKITVRRIRQNRSIPLETIFTDFGFLGTTEKLHHRDIDYGRLCSHTSPQGRRNRKCQDGVDRIATIILRLRRPPRIASNGHPSLRERVHHARKLGKPSP
jgi:hypothetical protein